MKPFRFKLQALLTLRQRADRRPWSYTPAVYLSFELPGKLSTLSAALKMSGATSGGVRSAKRAPLGNWSRRRRADAVWARGCAGLKRRGAEAASREALRHMLLARRDREAVEKHQQRQRQQFAREVSRAEQKELDELAQRSGLAVYE